MEDLPRSRSWPLAVPLTALTLFFLAACEDNQIGKPCGLGGADAGFDPTLAIVNPGASECPTGLCLLPSRAVATTTGAFCSAECMSDGDCGGETRDPRKVGDTRCQAGFVCSALVPKLDSAPEACKKVCVCKDFLVYGKAIATPEGC